MQRTHYSLYLFILPILLLLSSCASKYELPPAEEMLAYSVEGDDLLHTHAPVFVITDPEITYNRIGTPVAEFTPEKTHYIIVDPAQATIYSEERKWQGKSAEYTNLIYRVHFQQIPFQLIPFYLIAGKNTGLFIIITLNTNKEPLLITTLHTCGCYLSFTPTSFLDTNSFPDNWHVTPQSVYGEYLPGIIDYPTDPSLERLHVLLRHGTHRVRDLWLVTNTHKYQIASTALKQLDSLNFIHTENGHSVSFFETDGPRKDYVFGSQKIWERIFISWWALDWRVGEDKRLGHNTNDGRVFYTSLKPWAREASDLRDFSSFLAYWGWKL